MRFSFSMAGEGRVRYKGMSVQIVYERSIILRDMSNRLSCVKSVSLANSDRIPVNSEVKYDHRQILKLKTST